MKFKEFLKEYETYTDELSNTYDDEGNVTKTGASQGMRGLRSSGAMFKNPHNTNKELTIQDLYRYAKKLGVDKNDVDRYYKSTKGNLKVALGIIKNKARKLGKIL